MREQNLLKEIEDLKKQLKAKESERVETVDDLHKMEDRCISMESKLQTKTEEFDELKVSYDKVIKENNYLEKKIAEKDQLFVAKCNRLWEICRECFEKFGAKPEEPCWDDGEFDPFFSWLCRQYGDLPDLIHNSSDLSVVYATRAIFQIMKEAQDPLFDKFCANDYKFPAASSFQQVSSRAQSLVKKYFQEYWLGGGREHAFQKAKKRIEKVNY